MRPHSFILIFLCILLGICKVASQARWCTISSEEQQKCMDMKDAFSGKGLTPTITCVQADSKEECMSRIISNTADLITLDGGELFSGGREYDVLPIMEEAYADGKAGYYGVTVARKSNPDVNFRNLQGKTSCHTGYGRSAGWKIPVGFLLEEGLMPAKACQSSLWSAAAFFNQSCVPGALAEGLAPPGEDVSNLCALCKDPTVCSRFGDGYSGYQGAFRCMVEQNADVAFVKASIVFENTDGNNTDAWAADLRLEDFEILCRDGSRRPVSDFKDCHTAKAPSHSVVTARKKSKDDIASYVSLLQDAVELFGSDTNTNGFKMFDSSDYTEEGRDLLFKDSTEKLNTLVDVDDYVDFLGDYIGSLDGLKACPEGTLRFCTISDAEQEKCEAMRDAFTSGGITPELSCYRTSSHDDCIVDIKAGDADLVTLDGGDIYKAGKYGLVAVMAESYDSTTGDASYWAVAVVKSSSSFTIKDLKGKKSCHTGIMKTAGWIVPVGFLASNNYITVEDCDAPSAVGAFFTESCVPGALQEKYNPTGGNPDSLCGLCNGEGDDFCVRNDNEPYYDYSGAFRCLVEGGGDVAFIKQLTVDETIDSAQTGQWNYGLNKADYSYLCPDGTRQVSWTKDCSLSKVSSHALMTNPNSDFAVDVVVGVFTKGQTQFGSDTTDPGTFKLFDSSDYDGSDLLFKDSTQELQSVGERNEYDEYLTKEFIEGMETLDPADCGSTGNRVTVTAICLAAVLAIAHVLVGGA